MEYLDREQFMRLVDIVRPASPDERVRVLCKRVEYMDSLMARLRQMEEQGEETPEDMRQHMMEQWVCLVEFSRAVSYLSQAESATPTPAEMKAFIESIIEQTTGQQVRLAEIKEISEEEYLAWAREQDEAAIQMGREFIEQAKQEVRKPNPFFQADGTTYPADGSSRERGETGYRTTFTQHDNPIPGVRIDLSEGIENFIKSLEK